MTIKDQWKAKKLLSFSSDRQRNGGYPHNEQASESSVEGHPMSQSAGAIMKLILWNEKYLSRDRTRQSKDRWR